MIPKELFGEPQFDTHITRQEHLRRHLRKLLISGKLSSGDRLPAVHELANRWKTNVRTVHLALRALVREGLLTSVPRVGIYVGTPEARLTRVGIVHSQEVFAPSGSRFIHSLHRQLQALLEGQGIEVSVWLDGRPLDQQDTPWEALQTAATERKIQAIIVPALSWERMQWMEKLPVCAAYLSTAQLPNTVHLDDFQFIDLSLERLASQGCRSVAFLFPNFLDAICPFAKCDQVASFVGRFVDRATDMGMKVRNEWVRIQKGDPSSAGRVIRPQAFGYHEFHALWASRRHPDGLIVGDDVVMQGVVTAILETGVRVPDELKIVSSKNKNVDLLSPFPISHVVVDEREIAKALIEQVQVQFRGDRCGVRPRWIGFTLAPMESDSETA